MRTCDPASCFDLHLFPPLPCAHPLGARVAGVGASSVGGGADVSASVKLESVSVPVSLGLVSLLESLESVR